MAGRSEELEEIDTFLREAVAGRQRGYLSIFGPAGGGKSTLLNGTIELAAERKLLPVKLNLTSTFVETELTFYGGLFEAVLEALIQSDLLDPNSELMRTWLRQSRIGETDIPFEADPFEIGLLLAATANGRMIGRIPVPALQRDMRRLLKLAADGGRQGLVLCLDSAEYIDENRDIASGLVELVGVEQALNLVTAASATSTLQAAAPRAWATVEAGPFRGPGPVLEAIGKPLREANAASLRVSAETARDIFQLTGGQPYEVNLVCHFVWEAVAQGEQEDFELSPTVIEHVLKELEEKGRQGRSHEIEVFSSLGPSELRVVERMAPYEAMTVRQIALLRLMLKDFDEEAADRAEREVKDDLALLEQLEVVDVERDRFKLRGGDDARLYLKYAVRRYTGSKLGYGERYARSATFSCTDALGFELAGDDYEDARFYGASLPYEVGGAQAGRWLSTLSDAVEGKDIVALAELFASPRELEALGAESDQGMILFGLVLEVDLHEVDHAEVVVNRLGLDEEDLAERTTRWVEANRDLLEKYGIRLIDYRSELVPKELGVAAAVYAQVGLFSRLATVLFRAGYASFAAEALSGCVEAAEELVGAEPADPLIRTQLADALNRLGFLASGAGNWEEALNLLERSQSVALEDLWIVQFNRAYVLRRRGDLEEAVRCVESAEEHFDAPEGLLWLHAAFPMGDFVAPEASWNLIEVTGPWVERFVALQAAVLRAEVDETAKPALENEIRRLNSSAPAALLRLAGWAELVVFESPDRAIRLFEDAAQATKVQEVAIVHRELEHARAQAEPREVERTES